MHVLQARGCGGGRYTCKRWLHTKSGQGSKCRAQKLFTSHAHSLRTHVHHPCPLQTLGTHNSSLMTSYTRGKSWKHFNGVVLADWTPLPPWLSLDVLTRVVVGWCWYVATITHLVLCGRRLGRAPSHRLISLSLPFPWLCAHNVVARWVAAVNIAGEERLNSADTSLPPPLADPEHPGTRCFHGWQPYRVRSRTHTEP